MFGENEFVSEYDAGKFAGVVYGINQRSDTLAESFAGDGAGNAGNDAGELGTAGACDARLDLVRNLHPRAELVPKSAPPRLTYSRRESIIAEYASTRVIDTAEGGSIHST